MKLFIDTNIYLKFYHFTTDELEELKKLIILIEDGQIELLLPKQVVDEYRRNREVKIADALKKLNEEKLNYTFPVFCKDYEEYKNMTKAIHEYKNNKEELLIKLGKAIESFKLKADELIKELFSKAIFVEITDELIQRAKLRYDLGNPPGKNNSYGDALNWESLLIEVDYKEDIHFLSDDKDYFSQIDKNKFNSFLEQEWKEVKASTIYFYKSISNFFRINFPDIKLSTELRKDITIKKLEKAGSFQSARKHLNELFNLHDFNSDQINKIIEISINNNQVLRISEDSDINEILFSFIDNYENVIDSEILELFNSKINRQNTNEINDLL